MLFPVRYIIAFAFPALTLCLLACTGEKAKDAENSTPTTPVAETPQTPAAPTSITCWAWSKDDDLIGLTLTMTGNQASGKLTYTVFDRDRSTGNISGVMRGDTIIADYDGFAGSKKVKREVVLLFRDNAYLEGIGPTEEREGKLVFKSRSALTFVQERPLRSVPCHK